MTDFEDRLEPHAPVHSDDYYVCKAQQSSCALVELSAGHVWVDPPPNRIPGTFCYKCLLMRRRDLPEEPCTGPARFRL